MVGSAPLIRPDRISSGPARSGPAVALDREVEHGIGTPGGSAATDVERRARDIAAGLYPHQVEGVAFLLGRRRAILADDMGLGKTRQSVIALTVAEPDGPYLVVCPASVKLNWAREIRMALGDAAIHVVGPTPLPAPGFSGWTIINYDLLQRDIEGLLQYPYKGLVFDEGHYIKNHRTERSRLSRRLVTERAASVAPEAGPVVHVLTGTPLTNRPRDLFPLLQLVGHSLGQSFLAFAKRYCDGHRNDYGYWVSSGVSNAAELAVQLQGIMLRRSKDETLDLPPKQRTWIDVDVDHGVRENLNEAVAEFVNEERNARGGRLGVGMMSRARRRLAVAKVPVTLEYVRGAVAQGEKVILYSCFTHATRRFASALGDLAVTVTGEVPTPRRQALVDRFQTDDTVRVFIGQIHAAGVGINLTAGRLVVFNDLDWVPANHWQAEDRAHRIGQAGSVNVTYMIARGTLEEFVRTVLATKSRLIDDVVEGRALGDAVAGDVLSELRRLLAHLDEAVGEVAADGADPALVETTLRAASDRYLAEHTAAMTDAARRQLKPVSDSVIRALAAVLTGPERVVYSIGSSTGRSAYRLEVEGADITCDCKGFVYRGMCRHARDLKDALATGNPVPAVYRRVA